ncbi:MAG: radical SAM protein [Deltaproteobacteria bacterium]|nr:radical SAM protein [Deltaproteobacteria bacterium]
MKCIHCYVGDERFQKVDELKVPEVEAVMDQLLARNCLYLTLTGGEFFVRPDALLLAKMAVNKGFATMIQSNGSLIREHTAVALAELPICAMEVSVYGLTPEVHDAVTNIKGSYKRTISGLKNLRKYNVPTGIKFVITQPSAHQAREAKKWGDEIGLPYTISPQMVPARDGSNSNEQTDGFCNYVITAIADVANKGQVDIQKNLSYRRNCKPGINRVCISSIGKVKPCEFLPMELADLRVETMSDAWNKNEWKEFREEIYAPREGCSGCSAKSYCHVCPAAAYLMGESFVAQPKRGCTTSYEFKELWEKNL